MASEELPLPDEGTLYDEVACGLLLTDRAGAILKANLTFCRWLGMQRSDLCGKRFEDLLTKGGQIFHQTHFDPLLRLQGSVAEVKFELLNAHGDPVPVLVNAHSRQSGPHVWHELAIFVARDRHSYERELLHARKQAEQLATAELIAAKDRARLTEQMIGIVSHDLRNPLFTILLGATSLQRSDLDARSKSYLGHIVEAALRAEQLVEDLLDFTAARIGCGISVDPKPIDLHAAIAKCIGELRIAWPGRVLNHVTVGSGACFADSRRLFQVVGNLIGNAVAYGDAQAPIVVTSRVAVHQCSISVHNEGRPIPTELLPTLFRAMVRGTDKSSPVRSVGLGLYIVNEIARAHGGSVDVISTAEAGTTFTFTFDGCAESGKEDEGSAFPQPPKEAPSSHADVAMPERRLARGAFADERSKSRPVGLPPTRSALIRGGQGQPLLLEVRVVLQVFGSGAFASLNEPCGTDGSAIRIWDACSITVAWHTAPFWPACCSREWMAAWN